uniref:UDP-gluconosyltransferase n=1 Tax=Trialeurodes vaporariorum TaxID=88556 RepID=A0A873P530_TRIVP|nr:UDP-gluconosyltransferase [Trialeurodes vaporariorum]
MMPRPCLLFYASLLFLIVFSYGGANAANILALTPVISHSHSMHVNVLTKALAARGHKLVVLSPDEEKEKNENITTILLEGAYSIDAFNSPLEHMPHSEGGLTSAHMMFYFGEETCRRLLFSEGNKRFYRDYRNHKFDLILIDVGAGECFMKYAHVFENTPIVAFTAVFSPHSYMKGDFDHPAYVPFMYSVLTDRMTFRERFLNWFWYRYFFLARPYLYLPRIDELSQEFFGFYYPTVQDLENRIALFLANEHFSITHPKPRVPASIPVAGLHIAPPKPLPKDLKTFVSTAKDGVIYFSLGSNFESRLMSDERKRLFLDAFAQLPQRVLWKYEDDSLPNIPSNVIIKKWFPQTDILGHNSTVLFITHNGFLGTQEAVHYGVPMLGIPLLIDQFKINAKVRSLGLGLRLDLKEITSSGQILDKIQAILNDPSYKQNAKRVSTSFRDRPMTPLDTAVYWTEYVIRHKGADQLQVASLDLNWFQYHLLDIYAVIGVTIYAIYYVLKKILGAIFKTDEKLKKS